MYVGQNLRYSVGSVSFGDTPAEDSSSSGGSSSVAVGLGLGLGIGLLTLLLGVVTMISVIFILRRKNKKPRCVTLLNPICFVHCIYNVRIHVTMYMYLSAVVTLLFCVLIF